MPERVAFLGLGTMGNPMAAHLVRAGHAVAVWNRSPAKTARFAAEHGVRAGSDAADAGRVSPLGGSLTGVGDGPVVG